MQRIDVAADVERATWLTFRRTYSSWSHDKGVLAKVVVQIMGHTKVDATMNVYTQVLDGAARVELFRSRMGRRRQLLEKIGSPHWTISATG